MPSVASSGSRSFWLLRSTSRTGARRFPTAVKCRVPPSSCQKGSRGTRAFSMRFLQRVFFFIDGRTSDRNRKLTFDLNIGGRRSGRNFCPRTRPVARGAGCEPCKTSSEISSAASSLNFDSHSALASLRGSGSNGPPPRMLSNSPPACTVGDAGVWWHSGRFPGRIACLGITTAADARMANFTVVVVSPAKAPVLHKTWNLLATLNWPAW